MRLHLCSSAAWQENVVGVQASKGGALTCFVACALATGSKVKGFSDCQLCQVSVCLINVAGSSFRDELVKCVAIVGDVSLDLQHALPNIWMLCMQVQPDKSRDGKCDIEAHACVAIAVNVGYTVMPAECTTQHILKKSTFQKAQIQNSRS